jgi:thymidine kinase
MNNKGGYLELIVGCMYSGKTTRLLELYNMYALCDIQCCVINYCGDKRYHQTKLSTHDLRTIDSINTQYLNDVINENIEKFEVFLINEGQFFDDLYQVVAKLVDEHHKKVYVCGLDGDFERKKFGQMLDLIPICDKITKHFAICGKCKDGTKACFSLRLTKETQQVCIGSSNYVPVCRYCYHKYTSKTT